MAIFRELKSAGPCLSGASGCEIRELPAITCHQFPVRWSASLLSCQIYCSAVSSLLSGSLYYLLIGPRRCVNTLNFCPTRDFDRSRKPSKKHRKSACHKGSPRTLKQRPRGSQNGAQMVPKPPKNEIRILTRKATSKKTSKYQIRTLFAMFGAYPGPPKNILFHHFLETKTSPGASPKGTCKTACKKTIPFSQK